MARDFNYLARRMTKYATAVIKSEQAIVKDTTRLVVYNLVLATPIDVGTARSNWKVSIGAPFVGTARPAFRPYPSRWRPVAGVFPGGSMGERSNLVGVQQQAMARIGSRRPGEAVYISNHLPYIDRLNEGHSKLAQPGFVQRSVRVALQQAAADAVTTLRREFS